MIPSVRKAYNEGFTEDKYRAFLEDLESLHPGTLDFRVAETPVFVPRTFLAQMEDTCAYILSLIGDPGFKDRTDNAIPASERTARENDHPHFISFDFGACLNDRGELEPQLIELQAFPTLFAFQDMLPDYYRKYFTVPEEYDHRLGGYSAQTYRELLRDIIVGKFPPEEVVLLEVRPEEQKTRIDFYCTEDYLGIRTVCITDLMAEGKTLYYLRDGIKTRIRRVFNRVIFDDLRARQDSLGPIIDLTADWDVEWISHPNWFYRISKYMLPLMHHRFIPESYFLHDVKQMPADLGQFVLKPLFSFAGQGVIIDITENDILSITDPQNWILQRKVPYAESIVTPDGTAKCEIRLMYFWKDGEPTAVAANNLARISKGKMIGTRYNKDKRWVGGTGCFFQP
jgi:hypothetical protein